MEEETDLEVDYQALPLRDCKTIRVTLTRSGDFAPLPYPIEEDEADTLDAGEQP